MPLFKNFLKHSPKTPGELVAKLRSALLALEAGNAKDKSIEKIGKEAADIILHVKVSLLGDDPPASPPSAEDVAAIIGALLTSDVLYHLIVNLSKLHFETRKDAVQIFSAVCKFRASSGTTGLSRNGSMHGPTRHPSATSLNGKLSASTPELFALGAKQSTPGLEYIREHFEIVEKLCNGYKDHTIALNCGVMLRDVIRDPVLTRHILESHLLDDFFSYVQINAFEVASDAFTTFKRMLTQHDIVGEFLHNNHNRFFSQYEQLLKSNNYATQRQSLKLLADILLARNNVRVMFNYVKSKNHLMLVMNLLRSSSRTIQLEAFHVFKVFVANPKKPADIRMILISNREKLLRFLKHFLEDRECEDEDFAREKADIMKEIASLEDDSSASESLTRSPSINSNDLSHFKNISFSSLASSQRQAHDHDYDTDHGTSSQCHSHSLAQSASHVGPGGSS